MHLNFICGTGLGDVKTFFNPTEFLTLPGRGRPLKYNYVANGLCSPKHNKEELKTKGFQLSQEYMWGDP